MPDRTQLEETRPVGHDRARDLVSSRVSGERVTVRTFLPPSGLSQLIENYWVVRWDLRDQAPHHVEMLADPSAQLVLEGDRAELFGVKTQLFTRTLEATGLIRAAKLAAGTIRNWTARSASDFTDTTVPLSEVLNDFPEQLVANVLSPEDDEEGLAHLTTFLLARAPAELDRKSQEASALLSLAMKPGQIKSANELARGAGLSLRSLQKLFQEYVGFRPSG